jgi:hypothetical protein
MTISSEYGIINHRRMLPIPLYIPNVNVGYARSYRCICLPPSQFSGMKSFNNQFQLSVCSSTVCRLSYYDAMQQGVETRDEQEIVTDLRCVASCKLDHEQKTSFHCLLWWLRDSHSLPLITATEISVTSISPQVCFCWLCIQSLKPESVPPLATHCLAS